MLFEMKIILLVVCALAAATTAQDCDALNKDCHLRNYEDHTLCQYTGINPEIVERGVSPEDIEVILKAFNDERSKIALGKETRGEGGNGQPPAALMYKLEYDEGLAKVAQRWTDQAKVAHDSCRYDPRWDGVSQDFAGVFQNFDNGQEKSRNWTGVINDWYTEVKDVNPEDVKSYPFDKKNNKIGHYAIGAWGDTRKVGCGFTMFPKKDSHESYEVYYKFYVCNFGPGGTWDQDPIYQVGEPCSKCDGECDSNVGLCEA